MLTKKESRNDRFGDVLIPRFVTVLIFVFAAAFLFSRQALVLFKFLNYLSRCLLINWFRFALYFFLETSNVFGVFIEQILGEMCWKKIVTVKNETENLFHFSMQFFCFFTLPIDNLMYTVCLFVGMSVSVVTFELFV